jgi:hypothetical protein
VDKPGWCIYILAGGAPAIIYTTPVYPPAPGGLRSKGRLMVVDIEALFVATYPSATHVGKRSSVDATSARI